ncbi:MAG: hypothetical protein ABIL09_23820 [Gemmatimonadota bacterium]
MTTATLFDAAYQARKRELAAPLLDRLREVYAAEELAALQVDRVDPGILSQRSGRGFASRDILETVLGNLLECVAPGSHNAMAPSPRQAGLSEVIDEMVDQVYAMVAQSHLVMSQHAQFEERALMATFSLLWELPRLRERARWNRFASLKDPAVWDAYLRHTCGVDEARLMDLEVSTHVDRAIQEREIGLYREFLRSSQCEYVFEYQMQLVMSTYPGWRVLLYHDVAHALTRSGPLPDSPGLECWPVPLLPRAISELGGRYYQADIHPETVIGDANFLDHTHRGLTTGQTGIIGSGCHILPCTLGGLSRRLRRRHPEIGDYVFIGTDADLMGPVKIGDHSVIGQSSEIYGYVELGPHCHVGSSVVIGTVKTGEGRPGRIVLGRGVRVGDGTVVENQTEIDLVIPDRAQIPARSHVTNDGFGNPTYVRD